MRKLPKLGYEPVSVELLPIKSTPPTEAELLEMSAFIARRKKLYAAQQRRAAARRSHATEQAEAA